MGSIKNNIIFRLSLLRKKLLGIDPRSQLQIAIDNGLTIGNNCHIMGGVIIDPGHCWLINIGNNVTIAPRCHILAHDASTKRELGYAIIGNVTIGDNTFIGAESTILPNVSIGKNCIIGAGSVVTKSIPDGTLAAGNPARVIRSTEEYMEKRRNQMKRRPTYDRTHKIGSISDTQKVEMKKALNDGIGFIE